MEEQKKLAILVGGGPAPGINSVISAAAIRSKLVGVEVLGVHQGFHWLMQGDTSHVTPLNPENVEQAHFMGGSILGISRANPSKTPETLEQTIASLEALGVDKLITIGGDGTAYCAMRVQQAAGERLRVVHVPKTIDNDIPLPPEIDTFGFQTARHVGVQIVKNIMNDARTTAPRWYLVVSMGRKAGHLALGIGKAAGANLTLIPEEYKEEVIPLRWVVDTIVGSIIKRRSEGRGDGVVVLAEGIIERLDPEEVAALQDAHRNEHGFRRLGDIDFGDILKRAVERRVASFGLDEVAILSKDIGYELRCADPIPYDMEYCRDLGYCAAKFVVAGGRESLVSIQGGHFKPIPFDKLLGDNNTRTKVRYVNIHSNRYRVARRYMTRLVKGDFANEQRCEAYGKEIGLSGKAFAAAFSYVANYELPSIPLPGTPSIAVPLPEGAGESNNP